MKITGEKKWRHNFPIITLYVTMETSGWIWPNFKLTQALMFVIITCKYEKDPFKKSREKVETSFSLQGPLLVNVPMLTLLWDFAHTFNLWKRC